MATHRAVETVCQTIVELLRDNYDPAAFSQQLEFRVVSSSGLVSGSIGAGVTLFLYRIYLDGTDRSPEGHTTLDGRRFRPDLPVDLHFVLTVWGSDPSLQHSIAGWMMRTLEDHGSLPSGLLNRRTDGVFRADEAVEVGVADLDNEELFRLWELIGPNAYQLSVPYYARGVRITSQIPLEEYAPVQHRRFHQGMAGAR
jgi:Pvc16 N-terminal domain